MKKERKIGQADELLALFVMALTAVGLLLLYSTSTYNGEVKFQDAGYYLKKQLFASVLGMAAFFVMARIDYHRVAAFATPLYLCSIVLSTAVLFVGRSYNGIEAVAGTRTALVSAGGICQGGGGTFSGIPDQ